MHITTSGEDQVSIAAVGLLGPNDAIPWLSAAPWSEFPNIETLELREQRHQQIQRLSGVSRARSASWATCYASVLAQALCNHLCSPRDECGIVVITGSAASSVGFRLDRSGMQRGWNLLDPFGLQHSIPSVVPTEIAKMIGARRFAISFVDGLFGFLHAIEMAVMAIRGAWAKSSLVIAAEEFGDVTHLALSAMGIRSPKLEGAVGFVLTKSDDNANNEVGVIAHGRGEFMRSSLPPPWNCVDHVDIPDDFHHLHNSSLICGHNALEVLSGNFSHKLLVTSSPEIGWSAIGFSRRG